MIDKIPVWINIVFIVIAICTIVFFYLSNSKPIKVTLILIAWSILHSVLAYNGFYLNTGSTPPRFVIVFFPSLILIIYGCLPKNFNWIKNNRRLLSSTFLHTVRLPIEIVLFYLFLNKMIPQIMTFKGFNFDIMVGIAAPVISILLWKKIIDKKILLLFNIFGLILVLTILSIALLSSELPIQQFAHEQPNRAINYFPFILLPALIVPVVIYTHVTDIIRLTAIK